MQEFKRQHDILVEQKESTNDEDVQGILSKARGYMARTAMILHCLEQAITKANGNEEPWRLEIGVHTVHAAASIINHLNQPKFIISGKDKVLSGASPGAHL